MTHNEALKLRDAFAHYPRGKSRIHEDGDGAARALIEYRRVFAYDRAATFLEHRVLGPGGHPFADGWYLVCDTHWRDLSHNAPELLRELCQMTESDIDPHADAA